MAGTAVGKKAQSETVALFVSDLHLQQSHPATAQAFLDFLRLHARKAGQLYLLGDVFEYWVGDDDTEDAFNRSMIAAIRQVSEAGVAVFWMAGNRDFLVGSAFAQAAGLTLLPDPSVIDVAGLRFALVHGDAQCTDDAPYMAFRAMVRQADWQAQFLAMPMAQRKAIVHGMRRDSREAQKSKSYEIMDVNADAIAQVFKETGTTHLIHGHTHRPARHAHAVDGSRGAVRYVLPDWECDEEPRRGGWIGIDADGTVKRYDTDGRLVPW